MQIEMQDVNGDGKPDLVLTFDQAILKLNPRTNSAFLSGYLKNSQGDRRRKHSQCRELDPYQLKIAIFIVFVAFCKRTRGQAAAATLAELRHGTDSSCGELEQRGLSADGLTRETDGRHLTTNGPAFTQLRLGRH